MPNRVARKINAALERRQAAYKPTGPSPKHTAHKPGSQNRNKGYGKGSKR